MPARARDELAVRRTTEHLPWFPSAVLAAIDGDGLPCAVRARARVEDGLVRLSVAAGLDLRVGPASILCASYDRRLWHQRSFLVRGSLERAGEGWALRPERFIPAEGLEPFPVQLRRYRRTTRQYLRRRGLPRPRIDWGHVARLWDRAAREQSRPEAPDGLPERARAAVSQYLMAEMVTLDRDGAPIVWPTGAFFDPLTGTFRGSSSIAMPAKPLRIRRDPRVAVLFSNPTWSELRDPPAVLFQGHAAAPDELWLPGHNPTWDEHMLTVFARRPVGVELAQRNRVTRALFDWYLIRLPITVTPTRARWWPRGDATAPPDELPVPATARA